MLKYLGIDFGLKHLGLAIADGPLAEPRGEKLNNQTATSFLRRLVETEHIDKIVIGLPEGRLAAAVKDFGQKLARQTGRKVIYQDETLSTKEAKIKLLESGAPRSKRRRDHRAAAALILQEFIDMIDARR